MTTKKPQLSKLDKLRILSIDVGTRQPGIAVVDVKRSPVDGRLTAFDPITVMSDPMVPSTVRNVRTRGTTKMTESAVDYFCKVHVRSTIGMRPDVILIEVPKAVRNRQIQVIGHVIQAICLVTLPRAHVCMVSARLKTDHLPPGQHARAKVDDKYRKNIVAERMQILLKRFGHDKLAALIDAHTCRWDMSDALGMLHAWALYRWTKRAAQKKARDKRAVGTALFEDDDGGFEKGSATSDGSDTDSAAEDVVTDNATSDDETPKRKWKTKRTAAISAKEAVAKLEALGPEFVM
jgi:hypothetical protein